MVLEHGVDAPRLQSQRWLCRYDTHRPFAYARGHDFVRASDDTLWAHLCDRQLLSARSGTCLAYQRDNIFYDATTHQPLYYMRS